MKNCPNCATQLLPTAQFCHKCGEKQDLSPKKCPKCAESNPAVSVFCHHCGHHFSGKTANGGGYKPRFPLRYHPDHITEDVKSHFFKSLRDRLEKEGALSRHSAYLERFYRTEFSRICALRIDQIAEDLLIRWEKSGEKTFSEIDQRLETAFEGLLDYFTIKYCQDLNRIKLPETILKYETTVPHTLDPGTLIADFLDFKSEDEVFYFDFVTMPSEYLANACKHFLFAERGERVYFIADMTIKGHCKQGLAMTDKAIYWKEAFDKPYRVAYSEINTLKNEQKWLLINGHFFTTNPSFNLKMYKLLRKLKQWHAFLGQPASALRAARGGR